MQVLTLRLGFFDGNPQVLQYANDWEPALRTSPKTFIRDSWVALDESIR